MVWLHQSIIYFLKKTKHLEKDYFIFRVAFAALITPVGFFSKIYLIILNWCNFVRKFRWVQGFVKTQLERVIFLLCWREELWKKFQVMLGIKFVWGNVINFFPKQVPNPQGAALDTVFWNRKWSQDSLHLVQGFAKDWCQMYADIIFLCCAYKQSYPTVCDPVGCSPQGSAVHEDSPGENPGVGCHGLLQGSFPTQGSSPGLPDYRQILYHLSHQGSPWILEWVAYSFSRGSSQPRNQTGAFYMASRFFSSWATREAHLYNWERLCCVLSLVQLFATPWTVAPQAPLSMGIFRARTLEWVAMPSSRESSQPRVGIQVSHIAGRFFTVWATKERTVWHFMFFQSFH